MPCPKCGYSGEPLIIMPAALLNDWNPLRCPQCQGKDAVGYRYEQWFDNQTEVDGVGINARGMRWGLRVKLGRDSDGNVEVQRVEKIG